MKSLGLIRAAAASLAAVGVLCPQLPAMAQSGAPQTRVVVKADAKLAADIVKQGDKQVAKVKTDDKGVFNVKNLRPGTYTATAENTVGNFRVWNEKTAPPSAKGQALLVLGQNGARGQFGSVDPMLILLTAGVIASVIIAAITLDKVNSLDDDDDGATP